MGRWAERWYLEEKGKGNWVWESENGEESAVWMKWASVSFVGCGGRGCF